MFRGNLLSFKEYGRAESGKAASSQAIDHVYTKQKGQQSADRRWSSAVYIKRQDFRLMQEGLWQNEMQCDDIASCSLGLS